MTLGASIIISVVIYDDRTVDICSPVRLCWEDEEKLKEYARAVFG